MTLLLITTPDDLSVPLLHEAASEAGYECLVLSYGEFDKTHPYIERLKNGTVSTLYLRDPFNGTTFDSNAIQKDVELLLASTPKTTYIIDNLTSFDDVLFEDKWHQYMQLEMFMPETKLLTHHDEINEENIVKKRIASRSRGIIFSPLEMHGTFEDYIVQKKITIEQEYRVFVHCGVVEETVAIRSSKTKDTKMKMVGVEAISPELLAYTERVIKHLAYFDFIGLDIAQTTNGFFLIEVNRSPQFISFEETANVSLARRLLERVATTRGK